MALPFGTAKPISLTVDLSVVVNVVEINVFIGKLVLRYCRTTALLKYAYVCQVVAAMDLTRNFGLGQNITCCCIHASGYQVCICPMLSVLGRSFAVRSVRWWVGLVVRWLLLLRCRGALLHPSTTHTTSSSMALFSPPPASKLSHE